MIYGKRIEASCSHCEKGIAMQNKKYVICKKRGIVTGSYSCRNYVYDPLKRIPPKKPSRKNEFNESDFEI